MAPLGNCLDCKLCLGIKFLPSLGDSLLQIPLLQSLAWVGKQDAKYAVRDLFVLCVNDMCNSEVCDV